MLVKYLEKDKIVIITNKYVIIRILLKRAYINSKEDYFTYHKMCVGKHHFFIVRFFGRLLFFYLFNKSQMTRRTRIILKNIHGILD